MTETTLIVDGYNIIYKVVKYHNLMEHAGMKAAVKKLIQDLDTLQSMSRFRVMLVLDGRKRTQIKAGGVEVIYTDAHHTADSVIERLSRKTSGDLRVASADYEEQKAVFRAGVERMTPLELSGLINEAEAEVSLRKKPTSSLNRLEKRLPEHIRKELERRRRR